MLRQKGPTLSTLKGSLGLSGEPVRILINLKYSRFFFQSFCSSDSQNYFVLRATIKVEVIDCSFVPLKP